MSADNAHQECNCAVSEVSAIYTIVECILDLLTAALQIKHFIVVQWQKEKQYAYWKYTAVSVLN